MSRANLNDLQGDTYGFKTEISANTATPGSY